jgi:hypothetical protein
MRRASSIPFMSVPLDLVVDLIDDLVGDLSAAQQSRGWRRLVTGVTVPARRHVACPRPAEETDDSPH